MNLLRDGDWIWFLIYASFAVFLGLMSFRFRLFSNWLLKWSQVIGFLVTGFLTVGLLVLYNQQKRLEQTKYEPTPWLEGYYTKKGTYGFDHLIFVLSNVGDGTALDLRVRTEISFPKKNPNGVSISPRTVEIEDISKDTDNYIPVDESYLYPNTRHQHFRVSSLVTIEKSDGESMRRTLRVVPQYLQNDISFMRVKLTLLYRDKLKRQYEKELIDEIWPVEDDYSLNQMLIQGAKHEKEDPFELVTEAINTNRMPAASEETIQEGTSPILNMFMANQLDEERLEVITNNEGGFNYKLKLDEDYKEELKEELESRGVKDHSFFEYEEEKESNEDN